MCHAARRCTLALLACVVCGIGAAPPLGCAAPELGDELGRALLAEARADSEYATRLRRELQVRPSLRTSYRCLLVANRVRLPFCFLSRALS